MRALLLLILPLAAGHALAVDDEAAALSLADKAEATPQAASGRRTASSLPEPT